MKFNLILILRENLSINWGHKSVPTMIIYLDVTTPILLYYLYKIVIGLLLAVVGLLLDIFPITQAMLENFINVNGL